MLPHKILHWMLNVSELRFHHLVDLRKMVLYEFSHGRHGGFVQTPAAAAAAAVRLRKCFCSWARRHRETPLPPRSTGGPARCTRAARSRRRCWWGCNSIGRINKDGTIRELCNFAKVMRGTMRLSAPKEFFSRSKKGPPEKLSSKSKESPNHGKREMLFSEMHIAHVR